MWYWRKDLQVVVKDDDGEENPSGIWNTPGGNQDVPARKRVKVPSV